MKSFLSLFLLGFIIPVYSQQLIDVADITLKVPGLGEEELWYAFASGDEIVFDFLELKGNPLKEIEISEYPSTSKFMDFKAKKIENKRIKVGKTGIYKFRFTNSAIAGRVIKVNIRRKPGSADFIDFNTSVQWVVKSDTTWIARSKEVLDTSYTVTEATNAMITVDGSKLGISNTKNSFQYNLPSNTKYWTYRIGVGQEAQEAKKIDMIKLRQMLESKSVAGVTKAMGGTGLEGYALGYLVELTIPKSGEDVDFSIVDYDNRQLFYSGSQYKGWKHGNGVVVDFGRLDFPTSGTIYFVFKNDNIWDNINVEIDVIAVIEVKKNKTLNYKEPKIKTWKEPTISGL